MSNSNNDSAYAYGILSKYSKLNDNNNHNNNNNNNKIISDEEIIARNNKMRNIKIKSLKQFEELPKPIFNTNISTQSTDFPSDNILVYKNSISYISKGYSGKNFTQYWSL
jgi:hypothetical protein